MTDKDTSCIPEGCYCHDDNMEPCPYWSIDEGLPEQYNGYCAFLDKNDMQIAREREMKNMKTGEIVRGDKMPFPVSLLWDQCKECGINELEDDEE